MQYTDLTPDEHAAHKLLLQEKDWVAGRYDLWICKCGNWFIAARKGTSADSIGQAYLRHVERGGK